MRRAEGEEGDAGVRDPREWVRVIEQFVFVYFAAINAGRKECHNSDLFMICQAVPTKTDLNVKRILYIALVKTAHPL